MSHNHNKSNGPPKKKRKVIDYILFADISSFIKNGWVKGHVVCISPIKLNKKNQKYLFLSLMQYKKGELHSFKLFIRGAFLSKAKNLKVNDYIKAFVKFFKAPNATTTCKFIGVISSDVKNAAIIKINAQAKDQLLINIANPSCETMKACSEDENIEFAGVIRQMSLPQNRTTKKGIQTLSNFRVNIENQYIPTCVIWNLSAKAIKNGDVIQVTKARKKHYHGETSIIVLEYAINAKNPQSNKLKKLKLKPDNELQSFEKNFDVEYAESDVFRINKLNQWGKQLRKANVNADSALKEEINNKKVIIVPGYIEHMDNNDYYADSNNAKVIPVGNHFVDKNKKTIYEAEMIYCQRLYVKDNENCGGGLTITLWNDAGKKFYGIDAEEFNQLSANEMVQLFSKKSKIKYEFWCQLRINKYLNQTQLVGNVDCIKIAAEEVEYDFVEASDDEDEDQEFVDACDEMLNDSDENDTEYFDE